MTWRWNTGLGRLSESPVDYHAETDTSNRWGEREVVCHPEKGPRDLPREVLAVACSPAALHRGSSWMASQGQIDGDESAVEFRRWKVSTGLSGWVFRPL